MTEKNAFCLASTGFLLVLGSAFQHCSVKAPLQIFPYKLVKPDAKHILDQRLSEVSGLSFTSRDEVALIDDESGTIFFYSLSKNQVTRKIQFDKSGDYEDLKVVQDTAYVLRSDGVIYRLSGIHGTSSAIEKTKLETGLSRANDTEGICYDDQKKVLLIACKEKAELKEEEKKFKNKKAVYSYDPVTNVRSEKPVVLVDVDEVEKKAYGMYTNVLDKFMRFYMHKKPSSFEPSGIGIHPITRELYLTSSVGNVLAVVDTAGKISHAVRLAPSLFKQPEGIAFDAEGNLYITNEGRGGKGNILKFQYEKPKHKDLNLLQ